MKNNNIFQQRENNKLTIFYDADNIDLKTRKNISLNVYEILYVLEDL